MFWPWGTDALQCCCLHKLALNMGWLAAASPDTAARKPWRTCLLCSAACRVLGHVTGREPAAAAGGQGAPMTRPVCEPFFSTCRSSLRHVLDQFRLQQSANVILEFLPADSTDAPTGRLGRDQGMLMFCCTKRRGLLRLLKGPLLAWLAWLAAAGSSTRQSEEQHAGEATPLSDGLLLCMLTEMQQHSCSWCSSHGRQSASAHLPWQGLLQPRLPACLAQAGLMKG